MFRYLYLNDYLRNAQINYQLDFVVTTGECR